MLALEHKWIWDFWIVRDGLEWKMLFLHAPKSLADPEMRHWNVTMGHAVSRDLRNWTYLGEAFAPTASPGWDDFTTWTGSVVREPGGPWHLFYTGTSRLENGLKQRIGRATSGDFLNWKRSGPPVVDLDPGIYEEHIPGRWHDRAMRDPWVIRDPDGDGWIMYFTARSPGIEEANDAGCIGFARSADLRSWTLHPPVHVGGFGQLETPQVLRIGSRWYCLFSTAAGHWSGWYRRRHPGMAVTGTHYLVADSCTGPWRIADGEFFDGALPPDRYCGKIIDADEGLVFMGFLHDDRDGRFIGAISDPVPLSVLDDGRIALPGRPARKQEGVAA